MTDGSYTQRCPALLLNCGDPSGGRGPERLSGDLPGCSMEWGAGEATSACDVHRSRVSLSLFRPQRLSLSSPLCVMSAAAQQSDSSRPSASTRHLLYRSSSHLHLSVRLVLFSDATDVQ